MTISRRQVIQGSLAAPALYFALAGRRSYADDIAYEECGVASGNPTPDSLVLWTRVPPAGRNSSGTTEISYEVSSLESFSPGSLITSAQVTTDPSKDFTVRVKVEGLEPYTTYFYRFRNGPYVSDVGRAKTAPGQGTTLPSLSFAVVSCQKYSDGYYTALAALNQESVAFCVHLGDHIYEKETGRVRSDDPLHGREAITLDEYRLKYRHYLSDPSYREARRRFTWIDLSDDHEVFNDYAGARDREGQKARVAAAYQAYSEYMPIDGNFRFDQRQLPSLDGYNSLPFGPLVEFFRMDQRQYRRPNPCTRAFVTARCPQAEVPEHSMLGQEQLGWLKNSLGSSGARWKLLLSQVMLTPLKIRLLGPLTANSKQAQALTRVDPLLAGLLASGGTFLNLDAWDGYPAERQNILQFIRDERISSVVALTGDIHASANGRLLLDGQAANDKPAAYEIVGTSLTSSTLGDRLGSILGAGAGRMISSANSHLDWSDINSHGYMVVTVTEDSFEARHVNVASITTPTSTASVAHRVTLAHGFNI